MTIQSIAINALKISPMNVRKSKRQHIAALADDIAAHGLIHNLVGYKNGKGYHVVAGGRRLEAIRLLQKDGRLGPEHAVPVSIRPKKEAIELSLAENQSRDDMHPADAIEAYRRLASEGLPSDDIAARFGVMTKQLAAVSHGIATIAEQPAMQFTPNSLGSRIEAIARLARRTDHDRINQAHADLRQASQEMRTVSIHDRLLPNQFQPPEMPTFNRL